MSTPPAAPNDPVPISLPEEITRLDYEVTPTMEPLVSLLQTLAKAAPSAIRNKHKLYSIIIRAREICNHILAIGIGPESVGLEVLNECYSLIDSLEEHLLQVAQLLVIEQGALGPESCASWSEARAGLVAIMYGLYKPPFTELRKNLVYGFLGNDLRERLAR
ncbi:hypothetical protein FS837_002095 [Tulasnella sp. UAMH 9824]|nr:hypothetical protein FS837_002095 [Tulasnella sp. UAMH 9824]